MKKNNKQNLIVICCAVFESEIMALKQRHWPEMTIHFESSMLHMRPDKLASRLDMKLQPEFLEHHNVLLIYGDCCMEMADFTKRPGVVRVCGNNCCELLLGKKAYKQLSHEGAFFLFPEWARRWRHVFNVELGLNRANAASLMGEMHSKLVYLNTGVVPVSIADLKECAGYCGLPWEVMQVSIDPLFTAIQNALNKLNV